MTAPCWVWGPLCGCWQRPLRPVQAPPKCEPQGVCEVCLPLSVPWFLPRVAAVSLGPSSPGTPGEEGAGQVGQRFWPELPPPAGLL